MAEDERFISRWARLKNEVKDQKPADQDVASLGPEGRGPPAEITDEATAEVLDLPDIDSLTEDSDFTQFMQDGVPDEVRKMALRKMWRLTPGALPDGLDDYDDDYTLGSWVVEKVSSVAEGKPGTRPPEDETALSQGEEAATEPAPSTTGEEDIEVEESTDAASGSEANAVARQDNQKKPGKA